ncbi:hypothetical protein AGMMS50293_29840 [Spirochaetia bacterium]|nr:hypothetical protein AGMMS50293_29840 [Spirochaetia bacterium]
MQVLFFIGNGFDLNVGLHTQFRDVLSCYIKEQTNDPQILAFKNDINKNFDNWSSFEKQMGVYTENFSHDTDAASDIITFDRCISDFYKFLHKYLTGEENKAAYTNVKEIEDVFMASVINFQQYLENVPNEKITKMFRIDTVNFDFINFNYTKIFDKCINILKNSISYAKINKKINTTNLNVTSRYLREVFHIHGTLTNKMALGVDNKDQIRNPAFRSFALINSRIKPLANTSLENGNNQTMTKLINTSDIYCIFGMSIGSTDKTWWIAIANQLIANQMKRLVIFWHDDTVNPIFIDGIIATNDMIITLFCKEANLSDEQKNIIEGRIHIAINKEIFKIKLC